MGFCFSHNIYKYINRCNNEKKVLKHQVQEWDSLSSCNIPFFAPFYYYPESDKNIHNAFALKIQQMILDFKDAFDTNKTKHIQSLRFVITQMERMLKTTFGENLRELTLVCVPASTPMQTLRRYYLFSKKLCKKTGMESSFGHITVMSSNHTQPKHLGGRHLNMNEIKFDKSFFQGKNIILFDDIVTSGFNMKQMTDALKEMDANVVGALAIGYTQHKLRKHPIQFDRFKKYQLK